MSQSDTTQGESFTALSVVERDQLRVIDATQLTSSDPGQPPYPGAERVLKVTIPVDPDVTDKYKLHLPIDRSRSDEIDIDPCGYVENEYYEDDEYLKQLLVNTPTVDGPQVSGTGRQLLNIDTPKLLELGDSQASEIELPEKKEIEQLRTIIDTHERDCTTPGSHAHTLVNPQTRTVEVSANGMKADVFMDNDNRPSMPVRSVIYNELCAIVAERLRCPDISMRLDIDNYRKQSSGNEYALALEILEWLRDHPVPERFSYQEISELLTAAGYATHPITYLTLALNDLANGMPLKDVIYNGSVTDIFDSSPEKYYNREKTVLQNKDDQIFDRLHEETVETVTFQKSNNTVVKEWWVRDPPAVYPLPVLRHILFHRNIATFSEYTLGEPFIPTTKNNTIHSLNQSANVGFRFQNPSSDLQHPYRLAMAGNDACQRAIHSTKGDVYWDHKQKVFKKYAKQSTVFEGINDIINWITGEAPTDVTTNEIVWWFQ